MEAADLTAASPAMEAKPVAHAHCLVGFLSNVKVYACHCLEEQISLTLQMDMTDCEPLASN